MKLDTANIENYANMTAEEKIAALEAYEFEETKKDDGEINNLKQLLSKRNGEIADMKRQLKAKRTDEENEAADQKQKFDEMTAELEELRKQNSLNKYKSQYLGKRGFTEELANQIAEAFVNGELDKVSEIMSIAAGEAEKLIRAEAMKDSGRLPPAGKNKNPDKELTDAEKIALSLGKSRQTANQRSNDILSKYIK